MVDLAVKIRDRLSLDSLNIASLVGFNFLAVAQYVAGDQSFLRASQLSDPSHNSRLDGHAEVIRVVDSVASSDGFDRIIEAMHNSDPTATDLLAGKTTIIASFPATLVHGDHFPIAAIGSHSESIEAIRALMIQPSSTALHQMLGHDDTHAGVLATTHSTPSSSASQSEHSSLEGDSSRHGAENTHQPEGHGLETADHVPDQTTNQGVSTSNLSSTSAVLLTAGSMFENFEGNEHSVQNAVQLDRTSPSDTPGNVFVGSSTSVFSDLHAATPLQTSSQVLDAGLGAFFQNTDNDSSTGYSLSFADQTSVNTSDSSAASTSSYPLSLTPTGDSELRGGTSGGHGSTAGLNTTASLVTVSAVNPATITPVDDHDPDVQTVSHTGPISISPVAVSSAGSGSSGVGADGHSGVGTVSGVTIDPTGSGSSSTSGTVGVTVTSPAAGAGGSGIAGGVVPPVGSSDGGATSAGGASGPGATGSVGGATAPSHVNGGAGDQSGGAQGGGTQIGGSSTGTGTGSSSGTVAGASAGASSGSVTDHNAGDTGGDQTGTGTSAGSGSSGVGADGHSGVDAGTSLLQGEALAQFRDNLLKQISGLLAWHSTHTTITLPTTGNTPPGTNNPQSVVHHAPGSGDSGNPVVAHTTSDTPHIDGGALAQERADLMRLHDILMQQAFGAEPKVQASVIYAPQASAKSAATLQPAAAMMAVAHTGFDATFQDEQSPMARGEFHGPASSPIHHDVPQEHHQTSQDLHSPSYDDAHHLGSHPSYYDHF